MTVRARMLAPGHAAAPVSVLSAPLSLWGGLDLQSGEIIDQHHPQSGLVISKRILVMSFARGSSSSSSALLEMVRLETAPAGIVLSQADPILTIGSLVAAELYQVEIPIIVVDAWDSLKHAKIMKITPSGTGASCDVSFE